MSAAKFAVVWSAESEAGRRIFRDCLRDKRVPASPRSRLRSVLRALSGSASVETIFPVACSAAGYTLRSFGRPIFFFFPRDFDFVGASVGLFCAEFAKTVFFFPLTRNFVRPENEAVRAVAARKRLPSGARDNFFCRRFFAWVDYGS